MPTECITDVADIEFTGTDTDYLLKVLIGKGRGRTGLFPVAISRY